MRDGDAATEPLTPAAGSRPICLSCGYNLAGLETPTCPECGADATHSLRPAALDFLDRRDANRLSIGVQLLTWSIWTGLVAVLIFMADALTRGESRGVTTICGVPIAAIATILWLAGWHSVALIRATGSGPPAGFVKAMLIFAAWLQTITSMLLIANVLVLLGVPRLLSPRLVLATAAFGALVTLGFGQWRFASLAARSPDANLRRFSGIVSSSMFVVAFLIAVLMSAAQRSSSDVGAFAPALLASLLGMSAMGAWARLLVVLRDAANARVGPEDRA